MIEVAIQTFIGPVSDDEEGPFSGLPDFGGHNRGSKFVSWKYSPNEDSSKYFLEKSNIGNCMISFYNVESTCFYQSAGFSFQCHADQKKTQGVNIAKGTTDPRVEFILPK